MTNIYNPRGADLIGTFNSAKFDLKVNKYVTVATDATPLYVGDFVKTTGTSDADGIPICTKADAGDSVRGIISNIETSREDENDVYRKASTVRTVYVADDPYLMIEIQTNTTLVITDIGLYANIINNGGNEVTGLSNTQVDLSTTSVNSRQLRIIGLVERVDNSLGLYAKVRCAIHDHELAHGVSGSQENIWKRTGTVIAPFNAGDSLLFGTGTAAFGGDVTIAGKLTVDGLIDPTALILDAQATAPAITDGTIYYNSVSKDFQFREDGAWHTLDDTSSWATVGNVGSGADYNSIEDARAAGNQSLAVIGDFNEIKNVTIGAASLYVKVTETCNMGLFQFFMNSTGALTIESGKTTYAYTSPGQLITNSGSGTLHMLDAVTDGTGCTAVSSIAVGNVNNRMHVSNCRCFLANYNSAGFTNAYNSSMISATTFIGGGAASTGAIVNLAGGIASSLAFEGTFLDLGNIITIQNNNSIISGVMYNATGRGVISLQVDANQIDNLNGDLELDITSTDKNQVSNCYIADIDLSDASAGTNKFSNIHNITTNMVIAGSFNQFVNFESDANITIDGSANWLSHARAVNVIDNGASNESFICSYTSYVDNDGSNGYISAVSEDGTLAANTDSEVVTQKAIKTYVDQRVLLAGSPGGQEINGGTLTTETLDLLNNAVDQLGIHIAGDGSVTIDRDTTIGETGTAGIVEVKDAADVVKVKLNPVGDSFVIGGYLGLGTSTPNTLLDVQGGQTVNVTVVNAATYDLLVTDYIVHVTYTVTGAVTSLTLPTAQVVAGRVIHIKDAGGNATTNNITIDTEGAETIDGAATFVISSDYVSVSLYPDGSNWFIF